MKNKLKGFLLFFRCFKTFTMRFTDKRFGIPEQFGIFNSLGLALILEGKSGFMFHSNLRSFLYLIFCVSKMFN